MLFILSDELCVLKSMRSADRDVMHYLCERVDFDNGIIGVKRKVSYNGIALDLSDVNQQGCSANKLFTLSRRQVRECVIRLVNAGLLVNLSVKGTQNNLVLLRKKMADLLVGGKSVQNKLSTEVGTVNGTLSNALKNIYALQNKCLDNISTDYVSEVGTEVGTEVGITSLHQYQQGSDRDLSVPDINHRFSMYLDWIAADNDLKAILFRACGSKFKIENIDQAWVSEFVSYWWGQSGRQYSQQQWTAKLCNHLVKYFRNPGLFEQQQGIRQVNQHFEPNNKSLAQWARLPKDDALLISWARKHGYGDGEPGFSYQQLRAWLKRKINDRLVNDGQKKIVF